MTSRQRCAFVIGNGVAGAPMKNASATAWDEVTAALRVFIGNGVVGFHQQEVPKCIGNDGRLGAPRRAPVSNGHETTSGVRGDCAPLGVLAKAGTRSRP